MAKTYREAGVDVKKAERFVSFIKKMTDLEGSFGGVVELPRGYKYPLFVSSTDGVGTKLMLAFLSGNHRTVGIDMVAMNVNDILCRGARPWFFLDYIACGRLDVRVMKDVMKGIVDGCDEAGCRLIGGETAEMPDFYRPGEYDLSGFCVGIVEKRDLLPRTKRIRKGDVVLGLASSGLHSNGFSFVRKVFSNKELKRRAGQLLTPTRIYVGPVLSLLEKVRVKQIAHITGGGFFLKAPKGLPEGLGLVIDSKAWPVPDIFLELKRRSGASKREMFSTFNMGIGMTLIVSRRDVDRALSFLEDIPCYVIGEVVEGGGVRIS